MVSTPLEKIPEFDCVVIVTDHSQYDYQTIVEKAKLVVDTRNATMGNQPRKYRAVLSSAASLFRNGSVEPGRLP